MTETIHFLSPPIIEHLLSGLLGRKVTATKSAPMNLKLKAPRVCGVYRDKETPITCLCVFDLPLSVYAAGAMLSFPGCTINDSLRAGKIDEVLIDTVNEILNICAQLFNDYSHQVFQRLYTESDRLPDDATSVLATPAGRLDLTVSVTGYGSGQMALLIGDIKGD